MGIFKTKTGWKAEFYIGTKLITSRRATRQTDLIDWLTEQKAKYKADPKSMEDVQRLRTWLDLSREYRDKHLPTLTQGTQIRYLTDLNLRIDPNFANVHVKAVNKGLMIDFKAILAKSPLKPKSQSNCWGTLSSVLTWATEKGYLSANPMTNMKGPRVSKKNYIWWENPADVRAFMTQARIQQPRYVPLYIVALETGMRRGEICGLNRSDINFTLKTIAITKQHTGAGRKKMIGPTKTGTSRTLSFADNPYLEAALHQALRNSLSLQAVFTTSMGNRVTGHEVSERFTSVLKHCPGIPYLVFHGLRHTFSSNFMLLYGDVHKLSKILGHTSIATTMKYVHQTTGAASVGAIHLDGHLGKKMETLQSLQIPEPAKNPPTEGVHRPNRPEQLVNG
jgi:integrase